MSNSNPPPSSTPRGLADKALAYAARGMPVVPLHHPVAQEDGALVCSCPAGAKCSSPAKHPRTPAGVKDATTDPTTIRKHWQRWPHANIGIACGHGVVVLDVDGPDAAAQLAELEAKHGRLPATIVVQTGREDGEHRYFKTPRGTKSVDLAPGAPFDLKMRGAGHYVVAPGSQHISGRRYTAIDSGAQVTEAPGWLLAGSETRRNGQRAPAREPGAPIPEGTRNGALASLAGSMRRAGCSVPAIEAALLVTNRERCRPPLDEREVCQIAASIGRYEPGVPRFATPQSTEAARELGNLLALPSVGLAVAGTRIVGRGREAIGAITLSNGDEIVFPKLSVAMSAASLMEQVVATVGAEPALKNEQARHTVALMRRIGELCESDTARQQAAEWGRSFLAAADCLAVDLDDQAQRWSAFARLRALDDPTVAARRDSTSIARQCLVLRALDGTLYVRSGWFAAHVRSEDHTVPLASVPARMLDAGWERPGTEGRVHARQQGFGGSDVQKFLTVPPDWDPPPLVNAGEHSVAGERVNAGEQTNARARACAHNHIHQRSPVHQHENGEPATLNDDEQRAEQLAARYPEQAS